MVFLVLGLAIFLGTHSIGIFAGTWRAAQVQRLGAGRWKVLYGVVSLAGFVLLVWGFGQARAEPVILWVAPHWMWHLTAILMVPAFIFLVAAYVPGTRIKAAVGHPMVLGTKVWSAAHLISNGTLAGTVLFGAFLVWSVAAYAGSRRRDRLAGTRYAAGTLGRDLIAVVIAVLAWGLFGHVLHYPLIGIRPLG
jgi:uncharacterized membrane protein